MSREFFGDQWMCVFVDAMLSFRRHWRSGCLFVQERALRKSETRINAELSDLDKSIILKEALLAQIKEGQASYETMQQVRSFFLQP